MRFAPVMRVNASQARRLRFLHRLVEKQQGRIRMLERERDQARADAELVLALVPDDRKRDACALVRTRHEIVNRPEVQS